MDVSVNMSGMSTTMTTKQPHPCAMDWSGWKAPEQVCKVCGVKVERATTVFGEDGSTAEYCKLHIPKVFRESETSAAKNAFQNLTLDHVRDEYGKKVTVNSLAELRAAEKRYNFALAVATDDGGTAANPPQHEPWAGDITHGYEKKFNLDPTAYAEAAKHVEAGVVSTMDDTLVVKPNASGAIKGKKKR